MRETSETGILQHKYSRTGNLTAEISNNCQYQPRNFNKYYFNLVTIIITNNNITNLSITHFDAKQAILSMMNAIQIRKITESLTPDYKQSHQPGMNGQLLEKCEICSR